MLEHLTQGDAKCVRSFEPLPLLCTSRTLGGVRLEPARWAKADIDQVAVTNRVFMSCTPSTSSRRPADPRILAEIVRHIEGPSRVKPIAERAILGAVGS